MCEEGKKLSEQILPTEKIVCIYKITNLIDGKIYIGSTKDLKKRIASHRYSLNSNRHHNQKLQNAWNKYGGGSFVLDIIEICSIGDRYNIEQMYLNDLKPYGETGYNICKNAKWGHKEHRNKMSKNLKNEIGEKDIIKIKELICKGFKNREIRDILKVPINTIVMIKSLNSYEAIGEEFNGKILEVRRKTNKIKKENSNKLKEKKAKKIKSKSICQQCEKIFYKKGKSKFCLECQDKNCRPNIYK